MRLVEEELVRGGGDHVASKERRRQRERPREMMQLSVYVGPEIRLEG